jgi:crotonobetainyl-CoA:carnitine CoA-transferase CaiB-like acyl-CoA transferase
MKTDALIGTKKKNALEGLRVLELGQLLAGPFASVLLAWFGAEVIKVESPVIGDPLRTWRTLYNGTALWWFILGRNKKCITVNLHEPRGQEIIRRLVKNVDVVIENFKPGTMEKWGLGFEDLKKVNSRVIMARVSGWGQDGPYSHKPGFASVAEAVGGLRYVTGYPDRPPVRPNLSLGDTLAGLHAALGILAAVYHRDVASGSGQVVDVAIYESVYNVLEGIIPDFDCSGVIREREGNRLSGIVPTGTYLCADGKYVVIGGNGDNIFKRLCNAMGHPEMASDPRFEHNNDRVSHVEEIEQVIVSWAAEHPINEVVRILEAAGVPVGPIYSVKDMLADPHFQARGMFEECTLPDGKRVKLPAITPKLSETPGRTEWIGPALGAHNAEILGDMLGFSREELKKLAADGVISAFDAPSRQEEAKATRS